MCYRPSHISCSRQVNNPRICARIFHVKSCMGITNSFPSNENFICRDPARRWQLLRYVCICMKGKTLKLSYLELCMSVSLRYACVCVCKSLVVSHPEKMYYPRRGQRRASTLLYLRAKDKKRKRKDIFL